MYSGLKKNSVENNGSRKCINNVCRYYCMRMQLYYYKYEY